MSRLRKQESEQKRFLGKKRWLRRVQIQRALYYWAKLYTEQLKKAEDYANLSKAIGIHILNFTSIPESDKYHNAFHIVEKGNGLVYFHDLELHTIELKKFADSVSNELSELIEKMETSLDIWREYIKKLMGWLEADFIKKGKPERSFWHNRPMIEESFDHCNSLVVLNDKEEIIFTTRITKNS